MVGTERCQPALQRVLDRARRLRGPGTHGCQPSAGLEVVPVLLQEERVPSGLVPQDRRCRPSGCRRDAALAEQVLRHVLCREPDQVDPLDPVQAVQVRERIGDGVGAVRSRGPTGGQHQQLLSGRGLRHMGEQRQGRLLRPVQVLDDQHQRPLFGHGEQHAEDGIEEDRPRLPVAARLRRTRPVAGRGGGQDPERCGRGRRDLGKGLGRGPVERLLEHGDERPVGDVEGLAAGTPQDRGPVLSERHGGLGDQPGLADPGLTAHEDQLPPVPLDGSPDRLKTLDLRLAADESRPASSRRRRWAQRGGLGHPSTLTGSDAPTDSQI